MAAADKQYRAVIVMVAFTCLGRAVALTRKSVDVEKVLRPTRSSSIQTASELGGPAPDPSLARGDPRQNIFPQNRRRSGYGRAVRRLPRSRLGTCRLRRVGVSRAIRRIQGTDVPLLGFPWINSPPGALGQSAVRWCAATVQVGHRVGAVMAIAPMVDGDGPSSSGPRTWRWKGRVRP